jgi:sugar lactone lactonase YvrE
MKPDRFFHHDQADGVVGSRWVNVGTTPKLPTGMNTDGILIHYMVYRLLRSIPMPMNMHIMIYETASQRGYHIPGDKRLPVQKVKSIIFKYAHRFLWVFFPLIVISYLAGCSMTLNTKQFTACTQEPHSWPESIDIDKAGNLYFTDAYEGTLYRIARNQDNTLQEKEELLIKGLKRASGISISQEENMLYMGLELRSAKGTVFKIIQVGLDVFAPCDHCPYAYGELKAAAAGKNITFFESEIAYAPNGVVFYKKQQSVYYTHVALSFLGYFTKKKGHIGKVIPDGNREPIIIEHIFSPNGIDIEPSSGERTLIVSTTLDNSIHRIVLSVDNVEQDFATSIQNPTDGLWGNFPDGLMCKSNGDVLVAAFGSGKIFYLARKENHLGDPIEIVKGLGNPTDLTIGLSSEGKGNSLYVTTKRGGLIPWKPIAKGKVLEIPDIENKIAAAKSRGK